MVARWAGEVWVGKGPGEVKEVKVCSLPLRPYVGEVSETWRFQADLRESESQGRVRGSDDGREGSTRFRGCGRRKSLSLSDARP